MEEIKFKIRNLTRAVSKLREAVKQRALVDEPFIRDSIIKRFEFSFELAWKTLKTVLEHEGFYPKTPRETLVYSFRAGLIDSQILWLEMLDSRNKMAHLYNEQASLKTAERIEAFLLELEKLVNKLQEKNNKNS